MDLFFRVSEVARELGVPSTTIRRLIEANLIRAQTTAGGHMRIAAAEVERLKKDGVPTPPRPLPTAKEASEDGEGEIRPVMPADRAQLSSVEAAESAPDVLKAAAAVRVLEHATRAGELNQRLEEQEDWWRKRKRHEIEAQEAEEAARHEHGIVQERQTWRDRWQTFAVGRIPAAAPVELMRVVFQSVGELLDSFQPIPPEVLTEQLVVAEVNKQLRPWMRSTERDNAARKAVDRLPAGAKGAGTPTVWQTRAKQAARNAVNALPDSADSAEIDAEARCAVDEITSEFHAQGLRKEVVGWASLRATLLPLTQNESDAATKAITETVSRLPLASSRSDLEGAAEEALAPYRKVAARRQAEEQGRSARQQLMLSAKIRLLSVPTKETDEAIAAVAASFNKLPTDTPFATLEQSLDDIVQACLHANSKRRAKEGLVSAALSAVYPWLVKHTAELDLEGKSMLSIERELKEDLAKVADEQLKGTESTEEAENLARRWLRREYRLR